MPEASEEREQVLLAVPHNARTRQSVIENMGLARVLAEQVDEAAWMEHLGRLQEALSSGTWSAERGSMRVTRMPTVGVGNGRNVEIEGVTLDLAGEYIDVASDGKLSIVMAEEEGRARLKALNGIEDAGFLAFLGGSRLYLYANDDSEWTIDVRELAEHMRTFAAWLTRPDRREYLRRGIRNRMAQGSGVPSEKPWTEERQKKFADFFTGVRKNLKVEDKPFQHLPILPRKTLSSRTWGIEIEAVNIEMVQTPEYWELKSDGSLRGLSHSSQPSRTKPAPEAVQSSFDHPVPSTEHYSDDCPSVTPNVTGDYDRCNCGNWDDWDAYEEASREWRRNNPTVAYSGRETRTGEWNSPVLRSYHSRGLKYLTDQLEERNTNDSAGIHVHVGAKDMTIDQAIQLSVMYAAIEPLFEQEYMRGENRHYCKPMGVEELAGRFKTGKAVKKAILSDPSRKGSPPMARDMSFSARYWAVNLASLQSHNTVEFRSMGPVYNYEHLIRWAYLCREMVNVAIAGVPQREWAKVKTMKDLVVLFSKYGKETPTPEWVKKEQPKKEEDVIKGLGFENRLKATAQPLTPGHSALLVNDDYTAKQTKMT